MSSRSLLITNAIILVLTVLNIDFDLMMDSKFTRNEIVDLAIVFFCAISVVMLIKKKMGKEEKDD